MSWVLITVTSHCLGCLRYRQQTRYLRSTSYPYADFGWISQKLLSRKGEATTTKTEKLYTMRWRHWKVIFCLFFVTFTFTIPLLSHRREYDAKWHNTWYKKNMWPKKRSAHYTQRLVPKRKGESSRITTVLLLQNSHSYRSAHYGSELILFGFSDWDFKKYLWFMLSYESSSHSYWWVWRWPVRKDTVNMRKENLICTDASCQFAEMCSKRQN